MTIMSWGNSDGPLGRCDARCHNAKRAICHCMCGGRYHGAGRDGTLADKVAEFGEEVWKAAQLRARLEGVEIEHRNVSKLLNRELPFLATAVA